MMPAEPARDLGSSAERCDATGGITVSLRAAVRVTCQVSTLPPD